MIAAAVIDRRARCILGLLQIPEIWWLGMVQHTHALQLRDWFANFQPTLAGGRAKSVTNLLPLDQRPI